MQYFAFLFLVFPGTVVGFKLGNVCERNACNLTAPYCSEQLPGVYRTLGAACGTNSTCTDCIVTDSGLIRCQCEKAPYTVTVSHGQACGLNAKCSVGECYRPCETFLFGFDCRKDRCVWDPQSGSCGPIVERPMMPRWSYLISSETTPNVTAIAENILRESQTINQTFPLTFSDIQSLVQGFLFQEIPLSADQLFILLDVNTNGELSLSEFHELEKILRIIFPQTSDLPETRRLTELVPALTGDDVALCLSLSESSSPALVAACASAELQGPICAADGGKFYCSLDRTCKSDCESGCAWLNTHDPETSRCVPAAASACRALGKFFCATTNGAGKCVDSCMSSCANGPVEDTVSLVCRSVWWNAVPSRNPNDWMCRFRHSPGQFCVSDIDCIYGKKKCGDDHRCLPQDELCIRHEDCALGMYCPSDPSGGQDPYFVRNCKLQKGEDETCTGGFDCKPGFACNQGVCKRLFFLPVGVSSESPDLCQSGQVDYSGKLCQSVFKGKRTGQTCESDSDCPTTDPSNALGRCECIGWWESDSVACKRCQPVIGDLSENAKSLREWRTVRSQNCPSFWTDSECIREKGDMVAQAYYRYQCELQTLAGGVSVLDQRSGCQDDQALTNYCLLLDV